VFPGVFLNLIPDLHNQPSGFLSPDIQKEFGTFSVLVTVRDVLYASKCRQTSVNSPAHHVVHGIAFGTLRFY
jgi:hypothetical protein